MTWHPILVAREVEPGRWLMVDDIGTHYGVITFVRRGDELGYRADRTDEAGTVTELLGYYRSLRAAAWESHMAFVRSHGAPNRSSYGA
jgi:hypothetical protein